MLAMAFRFLLGAAIVGLPVAASAKPRQVFVVTRVAADHGWQSVRLRLGGKGVIRFKATGKWVFNPSQPAVGGDGAGNLPTAGRTSYIFSGATGREGQLIGKIGDAAPFVAGANGVHMVLPNEIGRLTLMINDDYAQDAGNGLKDNSGHLRVRVDYER
jgi:hypothetical protein